MGTFEIKKVDLHEVDQLADISLTTFTEAFFHQNDPSDFKEYVDKSLSTKVLLNELNDPKSEFYFLYDDGKRIGYFKLNLGINRFGQAASDQLELQRIYVFKNNQSKGAGKYMMDYIVNFAKSVHLSSIWLGVWEHNPDAIRFYEKQGFKKVGDHHFLLGQSIQLDYIFERRFNSNS